MRCLKNFNIEIGKQLRHFWIANGGNHPDAMSGKARRITSHTGDVTEPAAQFPGKQNRFHRACALLDEAISAMEFNGEFPELKITTYNIRRRWYCLDRGIEASCRSTP